MVGIRSSGPGAEAPFCHGCGRSATTCAGSCGRGGPDDQRRFCERCGWRLREIAVVPGVASLWCRAHGLIDE